MNKEKFDRSRQRIIGALLDIIERNARDSASKAIVIKINFARGGITKYRIETSKKQIGDISYPVKEERIFS